MAFVLVREQNVSKVNGIYTVKLYFDENTNMLRNEYVLAEEILYHIEYEVNPNVIPEEDIPFQMIVDAFNSWYELVGPDWRPEAFPQGPYPETPPQ